MGRAARGLGIVGGILAVIGAIGAALRFVRNGFSGNEPESPAPGQAEAQAGLPEPAERRAYSLLEVEGIGSIYAEKLMGVGLKTTEDLLGAGASRKGREDLTAVTGISSQLILRWVNMADMFRVSGVGEEYSDLLEASGVDSVPELAQRRADNLTQRMAEANEQKKLVRRLPTESQVAAWIENAKALPRVVTY